MSTQGSAEVPVLEADCETTFNLLLAESHPEPSLVEGAHDPIDDSSDNIK